MAEALFQLVTDIQWILELQSQRYSILILMPSQQLAEDVANQLQYAEMEDPGLDGSNAHNGQGIIPISD